MAAADATPKSRSPRTRCLSAPTPARTSWSCSRAATPVPAGPPGATRPPMRDGQQAAALPALSLPAELLDPPADRIAQRIADRLAAQIPGAMPEASPWPDVDGACASPGFSPDALDKRTPPRA